MRLLDFRKIKEKDRKEAVELFKSKKGKDILKEIVKRTKITSFGTTTTESNLKGNINLISSRNTYTATPK